MVRSGYGIFYARTPGLMLSTAILQNGIDVLTYTLTTGFPTFPNVLSARPAAGLAPPNINVFDPNYQSPRVQQWNFQIEQELGGSYAVTLGYIGVHGVHLTRTRDINLQPEVPLAGTITGGAPILYYAHPGTTGPIRPNPAFGRISLFESGADSIYHGGFVQLTKRFSRSFQVLASYTFSKTIDDAPDATSVVVPNSGDDAKVARNTLAPNQERGRGVNDVRHRFVFSSVWDLNYGQSLSSGIAKGLLSHWTLSSIAQLQTGAPVSQAVTGDPNNDTNNNSDRTPGIGRNTLDGPGLATWDLRLAREIRLAERARLRLIGEGFDITNRANFATIQNTQYTFTRATGVFAPVSNYLAKLSMAPQGVGNRVIQLAAKITF